MSQLRAWVDVYNSTGVTRLGRGPIFPESITVTRALDGAGSFSVSFVGTDIKALETLAIRRVVEIKYEDPYSGTIGTLPRGVVMRINTGDGGSRYTLSCDGPDTIQQLKDYNTLLGRLYTLQNTDAIVTALATLAGWTVSGSLSGQTIARFDGESVLKALQALVSRTGYHMRLSASTAKQIEIGTFGADSGYIATHIENLERAAPSFMNKLNKYLAIESLSIDTEGTDIVNWIAPIGGGEGTAALTLEKSTRTTPYTIQTVTGPDGKTIYYISDSASISTYGQVQQIGTFKDISPLTNSEADIINAANALYDATVAYLIRHKDPLDTYSMAVRGKVGVLQPGDKLTVRYQGQVYREGESYTWRNINAPFWILEVTEKLGAGGFATSLKIASVDRYELDNMDVIIGALDELQIQNLKVQPYPNTRSYVWPRDMAPSYHADIPVRFTDMCLKLIRLQIRLKTSPYRITAQSASASGDHRHLMFVNFGTDFGALGTYKSTAATDSTGGAAYGVRLETTTNSNLYTWEGSGTHTHPLAYGITDDTQTPNVISVYVDGVDRSAALGGPWSPGVGTPITIDLDPALMTSYMNLASPGLRTEHTISVRCTGGRGHLEAIVEIYEIVQAVNG